MPASFASCPLHPDLLAWQGRTCWRMLSTDFAQGQHFLQAWAAWQADAQRSQLLHFTGILAQPLAADAVLAQAPAACTAQARELAQQLYGLLPGVHRLSFAQGRVLLTLWVGSTMTLRPLHQLARRLEQRKADDITPLPEQQAPREMQPMVQAFNGLIARIGLARQQQQRFVADASHQMRTPLAVLQLHAEAGLKGDISAQEALQDIARTTQRTTRLIHQLLMWNRAQQTAHAAADTVDLCALLQDVVVEQSPLLAQKGLDFALDAQPLTWYGEAWMLQEIVMNLLRNAITHTPAQGALGIRLTLQEKAVAICVWDSGPGLSPQMQQELFTPFVSESHQGVGLGLTISRDLAQACGGSLVIRNRVVQGKIAGVDAMLWLPHTARA